MTKADFITGRLSIRITDVAISLALLTLVLTYIDLTANTSHNAQFIVPCCESDFWLSPFGCALLLVACGLLLRLRRAYVYPVVMIASFFVLTFFCYVAFLRWGDYAAVSKRVALQQALFPLYRPLGILVSLLLLTIATENARDISPSGPLK